MFWKTALLGAGKRRRAGVLEAEMPLLLRTLGMLLDMKVPFAQALRASSRHGEAGKEFSNICDEIEEGVGVPKALAKFAEKTESEVVKRSVVQIITAYEHGARGEEIMRIADDLISLQKYKMRDFVSRSSLYGLLQVVFGAVVPTFFLVFATAGKFALEMEIQEWEFMLVFLLVLPAVNLAIILFSRSQMPPDMFRTREGGIMNASALLPAAVAALIVLLDTGIFEKIAALALMAGIWAAFYFREYTEESRLEKIEEALPNALLAVSGLPKNYGIEKIFGKMAEGREVVAVEAAKTLRQLKANVSVENALLDLWKRNGSFMLRRASELMLNAHVAGANVSEKMHEMAEDLLKFAELKRERENALSMQKYTLLLGAVIVPLILASSLGLVKQISSFFDNGESGVLEIAPNAIASYVVIYSALSAFHIAQGEGRKSRTMAYFAAMALVGLAELYIFSQQFT